MLSNSFENSSKSIVYMNTCGKNFRSARARVGFFRRKRFDTPARAGGIYDGRNQPQPARRDFSDGKDLTPRAQGGGIFSTEKILHRAPNTRPENSGSTENFRSTTAWAAQHINQIPSPPFCVCVLCLLTASPPPRQWNKQCLFQGSRPQSTPNASDATVQ